MPTSGARQFITSTKRNIITYWKSRPDRTKWLQLKYEPKKQFDTWKFESWHCKAWVRIL